VKNGRSIYHDWDPGYGFAAGLVCGYSSEDQEVSPDPKEDRAEEAAREGQDEEAKISLDQGHLMKLNRKHIPYFAAMVQTAQYSMAGYFLIGVLGWFFVGSMGALVSLAMAYGASQYADVAEKRKRSSLVALIGIMLLSPVLVGTATWLHLTDISNPYWRGVVSFAWGALPDAAVVLSGFAAGKGLFEQGRKPKKKRSSSAQRNKNSRSAKKKSLSKPLSEIPCRYAGAGCDRTFPSQNAANAHAAKCGFKPTIAMPVDVSSKEGKQI
jgi:hypothetical protein